MLKAEDIVDFRKTLEKGIHGLTIYEAEPCCFKFL